MSSLGFALIGLVGLSLLASSCGGSAGRGSTTPSASSGPIAFSHCMRSHGVPNFPDPDAQGNFPSFHLTVSKQAAGRANDACKHLLSRGGGGATPQARRQKLAFGLKVAQCLRRNGYPNFPDPSGSSQQVPARIDTGSPQFQSAETSCEQVARKALGLP